MSNQLNSDRLVKVSCFNVKNIQSRLCLTLERKNVYVEKKLVQTFKCINCYWNFLVLKCHQTKDGRSTHYEISKFLLPLTYALSIIPWPLEHGFFFFFFNPNHKKCVTKFRYQAVEAGPRAPPRWVPAEASRAIYTSSQLCVSSIKPLTQLGCLFFSKNCVSLSVLSI